MMNGNDFKLSVVIPAYNSSKYIEETLASIFNQTKPPFEIIVINDGSTDNTAEIVSKYPVVLINKTNEGPSKTRNRGIAESKGNWIAFLDADDLWQREKIEQVENFINKNPDTEMLSTGLFVGNPISGWSKVAPRTLFNLNASFFEQLYRRSFIATSSVVIKKEILEKVGGFDSTLLVAEDLDLWLRVALATTKYQYLKEHLLYYRVHDSSITSNPLNAYGDNERVFIKYSAQAGFKLFVKRMAILNVATTLTLYRQGRYSSMVYCFLKLFLTIIKSPFLYLKQLRIQAEDLKCSERKIKQL